ncbi:MAG: Proline dehydrogenase, partial [uncultured Nocardioidaceae bacterium]
APATAVVALTQREGQEPGHRDADLRCDRESLRPRGDHPGRRGGHPNAAGAGTAHHLGLPGRGHARPGAGGQDGRRVPRPAPSALRARVGPQRRGLAQALRARAGSSQGRREDLAGERANHLPRRPQRGHDGDPRHGGPHHAGPHLGHAARAAQGLPGDRMRRAVLPATHRGGLPGPCLRGLTGAVVQGGLQSAGVGGVPGQGRGGPVLRSLPEGADGRPGVSDGRHPRPADGRHRRRAGHPERSATGLLRVPDALRHAPRRAATARRVGGEGARLPSLRQRVVRLPDEAAGGATRQRDLLLEVAPHQEV